MAASSDFVLTSGVDVVLPSDGDQTVSATAQTLTPSGLSSLYGNPVPGDRLDGGAGYDVLALTGPGYFALDRLDQFAGFEEVRLTDTTSGGATLVLRDGADLIVTLSDGTPPATNGSFSSFVGSTFVSLGTGKVTLQGGNGRDSISANTPAKLVAGSSIDGGGGSDSLELRYDASSTFPTYQSGTFIPIPPVYRDSVYDLTGITLRHVETLNVSGSYASNGTTTIVKVDSAALADVTTLVLAAGAKLVTEADSLDLTHKTISGGFGGDGSITSANATGTTFTTDDYQVATLVKGGAGQDTLVLNGLTLTGAQRDQLFQGSIETLKDASGTYTKGGSSQTQIIDQQNGQALFDNSGSSRNFSYNLGSGNYTIKLSTGDNTVAAATGNQTIYSPAGAGQNHIDGGEGYDTLVYAVASTDINVQVLSGGVIKVGSHSDYLTNVEALQFTDKIILTSSLLASADGGTSNAPSTVSVALTRDTGSSDSDGVTNDARVTIAGAATGNALAYSLDGQTFVSRFDPAALSQGAHTLAVHQINASGAISADTILAFTLDTQAPVVAITAADGVARKVSGAVGIGNQADVGSIVTLYENATILGTAIVDATGHWSASIGFSDHRQHTLTAVNTDLAGNVGTSAAFVVDLRLQSQPQNQPYFGTVTHDVHSAAGEVYALYDALLARTPDAGGQQFFTRALETGAALKNVAQAILQSPEGQTHLGAEGNAAFVEQLYQTALGRQGDAEGRQSWVDALDRGASRADVAVGFAFSVENVAGLQPALDKGVFTADPTATDVARLYYGLLDRAPDEGGLMAFKQAGAQGASLTSLAQAFLNSTEYMGAHASPADAAFVQALYHGALGRDADVAGLQAWTDALAHGASRADVAVGIALSPEARLHLTGVIENGWHLA